MTSLSAVLQGGGWTDGRSQSTDRWVKQRHSGYHALTYLSRDQGDERRRRSQWSVKRINDVLVCCSHDCYCQMKCLFLLRLLPHLRRTVLTSSCSKNLIAREVRPRLLVGICCCEMKGYQIDCTSFSYSHHSLQRGRLSQFIFYRLRLFKLLLSLLCLSFYL